MSGLGRRRKSSEEDVDIDMVPVMNMFLVLIPFLLMSASFLHLKVINTSVPVQAESISERPEKRTVKLTVIAEIKKKSIHMSTISDDLESEVLEKWTARLDNEKEGEYPLTKVAAYLLKIKAIYPESDTLIVIPDESIMYDTIIQVMDVARFSQKDVPLFPSVVLSGKVG